MDETTRQTDAHCDPDNQRRSNPAALDVLLVDALSDTDYRFGQLNFPQPTSPTDLDDLVELPESTTDGWMTHRRIDMVLHPARGALLLDDCRLRPRESPAVKRDRMRRIHGELVDTQRQLRRRLDEDDYWHGRPIVLGIGLVVRNQSPDGLLGPNIPRPIVIDTSTGVSLRERLDEVFDFYATPATTPISDYGPRLVSDLIASPTWIGNFIDELSLCEMIGRRPAHDHNDPKAA